MPLHPPMRLQAPGVGGGAPPIHPGSRNRQDPPGILEEGVGLWRSKKIEDQSCKFKITIKN